MRRFHLVRREDETGVSGTGIVAEGIQFTSGVCVLSWLTAIKSIAAIYDNINVVEWLHGHGGKTVVKWVDDVIQMKCEQCGFDINLYSTKLKENIIEIENGMVWCNTNCYGDWRVDWFVQDSVKNLKLL